jgi:hypothetical protein
MTLGKSLKGLVTCWVYCLAMNLFFFGVSSFVWKPVGLEGLVLRVGSAGCFPTYQIVAFCEDRFGYGRPLTNWESQLILFNNVFVSLVVWAVWLVVVYWRERAKHT